MPTVVIELYEALKQAGISEATARAAAQAVLGIEERQTLATKADLAELRLATKADLAELKAELIKINAGLLVAMTAIFAAIVKLL
jgi:hypothetical protein